MSERLDGASVLVTGASSGIGAATVRQMAARGANIALGARREHRLTALADDVETTHGVETLVRRIDVTDTEDVSAFVDDAADAFGGLDVVVNNAGLGRAESTIESLSLEAYHQMMDVNCDGMFYVARASMPYLKESSGNLIFLGSMAGQYPRPASPVYAATKWWTRGLALSLQAKAGPAGVAVTTVNPTEVRTEFGSEDDDSLADALEPDEAASPEDVARAIVFAAEQESPNVVQELDLYRRDKFEDW